MATSNLDRKLVCKRRDGGLRAGAVKASTILPHGRVAFFDAATGTLTNTSNAGANKLAGMMATRADNSSGANGDVNGEFYIDGSFEMVGSGFAAGDRGALVYAPDNGDTLTKTSTNATKIGKIDEVISSTKVMVEFQV